MLVCLSTYLSQMHGYDSHISFLVIPETEAGTSMVSPFSEDEYRKGVATLKNNKAAGRDDVLVEQLKNLGPNAHKWLRATAS